ncbi:MAG: DUF364 domain-containing protein [Pseudaminobacter sp.]
MANVILKKAIEIVRASLDGSLGDIVIDRVATGRFFTGVKLSTGHAGACASPVNQHPDAAGWLGPAIADELRGCRADDLLEGAVEQVGMRRTIGIATLNALAQMATQTRIANGFEVVEGLDAFKAADVRADETVVVVGAFVSFLRTLREIGARHWVLEKDPSTLQPHEMPYFREAERAPEIVPMADVLMITGTTLANDTLGELMALARPSARIAVVGPTVTMIPEAFFERGCCILGGIKVTDPDSFLDIVAEGGAGHHFFGRSAVKVAFRKH